MAQIIFTAIASVLGYQPAYAGEEGIERGSGIWLLAGLRKLTALPPGARALLAIVAAVFVGLGIMMTGRTPIDRSADRCATLQRRHPRRRPSCAISAHYPWYFVWLAVPSRITPCGSVIFLSAATLLLYLNPRDGRLWWPTRLYAPAIAQAVLDLKRNRRASVAIAGAVERNA